MRFEDSYAGKRSEWRPRVYSGLYVGKPPGVAKPWRQMIPLNINRIAECNRYELYLCRRTGVCQKRQIQGEVWSNCS